MKLWEDAKVIKASKEITVSYQITDLLCRDITKSNNYISNNTNNLDFFVYEKALINKREEIINIPTFDSFNAKLKKQVLPY